MGEDDVTYMVATYNVGWCDILCKLGLMVKDDVTHGGQLQCVMVWGSNPGIRGETVTKFIRGNTRVEHGNTRTELEIGLRQNRTETE